MEKVVALSFELILILAILINHIQCLICELLVRENTVLLLFPMIYNAQTNLLINCIS